MSYFSCAAGVARTASLRLVVGDDVDGGDGGSVSLLKVGALFWGSSDGRAMEVGDS